MRTKALLLALAFTSVCMAKDIKTVMLTTNPEMHCNNCEKKIKENIRFDEELSPKGGCSDGYHSCFKQKIRTILPSHPEQRDLPT